MSEKVSAAQIWADQNWFPDEYVMARSTIGFVRTDPQTIAAQAFLDHRWDKGDFERVELPFAQIAAAAPPAQPKLNVIWHTSFCCSTLIAGLFDLRGAVVSLREPLILTQAAEAKRRMRAPNRLAEIVFKLLARGNVPVLIKPSNFANNLASDSAKLMSGKSLFLYSDLKSFLASVAKSHLGKYAHNLLRTLIEDSGRPPPFRVTDIPSFTDLQTAANAWHMQMAEFRRNWEVWGDRAASLDCEAFLDAPEEAIARINDFFGYNLSNTQLRGIARSEQLSQHAKQPGMAFDAAQRRMENDAALNAIGAKYDVIATAMGKIYPGTPAEGSPLPNPLMG